MVKFPEELPLGLLSTNAMQDVQSNSITKMTSGMSRSRRRFISTPLNTKFSFVFTSEQAIAFKGWFDGDCSGGQEWFLIKRKTVRGIEEVKARMTAMYSGPNPIPLSGRWAIEFNAEIKEERIDEGVWEFPDVIDNMCLLDKIVNKCWTKVEQ